MAYLISTAHPGRRDRDPGTSGASYPLASSGSESHEKGKSRDVRSGFVCLVIRRGSLEETMMKRSQVVFRALFLAIGAPVAFLAGLMMSATPAAAQHRVTLAWTASPTAAANPSLTYNVYRQPSCTGLFARQNLTAVTTTSFLDGSVVPGIYCYEVTAVLAGVESFPTSEASATIPGPAVSPSPSGCTRRGTLLQWLRCVAARPHASPPSQVQPQR